MKKNFLFVFAFVIVGGIFAQESAHETLFYNKPASSWMQESLPIGNGYMGASLFGGVQEETIHLNEKTLWEGGPGEWEGYGKLDPNKGFFAVGKIRDAIKAENYKEAHQLANKFLTGHGSGIGAFQPLGNFKIRFNDLSTETATYNRKLDLSQGKHLVSFTQNGVTYQREAFASYPHRAMVFSFGANTPGKVNAQIDWETITSTENYYDVYPNQFPHLNPNVKRGRTESVKAEKIDDATYRISVTGHLNNNGMKYAAYTYIQLKNGGASLNGNTVCVKAADEVILYFSAATDYVNIYPHYKGSDPAPRALEWAQKAYKEGKETLLKGHLKDYQGLYHRTALYFTKKENPKTTLTTDSRLVQFKKTADPHFLELLFNYGKYLLISASREGSLPLNLQGVWNPVPNPPWCSDYHTNINLQMAYWPAEALNLPETHKALLDYIPSLVPSGEKTATHYYGTRGWVCHTSTNPFGTTTPGWDIVWGHFPGGGSWLCRHLWDHYRYSQDIEFLRKVYPTMKGAAEFWMDWLILDESGKLISCPSYSPEHGTISSGATMDFQIAHEILTNTVAASQILKVDEADSKLWQEKLQQLPPLKIGRWGQLQEWSEDIDSKFNKHRHISHLYGLHPGNQISPQKTPELAAAAEKTLKARGDEGTGWSKAWKMNFHARLGKGEKSYSLLKNLVQKSTFSGISMKNGGFYANLWNAHPPFQIDGNFGTTAAFVEWVLQSHNDEIHLLPALPPQIPAGSFKGFKAAGNVVVSAKWNEGKLTQVELIAANSGLYKVRYQDRLLSVNLEKGKPLTLSGNLQPVTP